MSDFEAKLIGNVPTRGSACAAGYDLSTSKEVVLYPAYHRSEGFAIILTLFILGYIIPVQFISFILIVLSIMLAVFTFTRNCPSIICVSTGSKIAIPAGYFGNVRERSGLALKGLNVGAGVIDSDYTGDIGVVLRNVGYSIIRLPAGSRIAQLIIQPYITLKFVQVRSLDETARGDKAYGSSGA